MLDFTNLIAMRNELTDAIRSNRPEILEKFLKSMSYINLNFVDTEGETPLHRGCLQGNLEIIKLLVEYGANQSIKNKLGWFPIHIASYYGHIDVLMYLIDQNNFKHQASLYVQDKKDENKSISYESDSNDSLDKSKSETEIFKFD
jgi:ankyrin repeat protein